VLPIIDLHPGLNAMSAYLKPLPKIDELMRPYWEHARAHRLSVQRCNACGHHQFPPGPVCAECLSEDLGWKVVSGLGTLVSWCEFHRAYWSSFAEDVPYNVAVIRLDEGPHIISNLAGDLAGRTAELRQGLAVRAAFDDVTPEVSLVRFTKA
jgi:uncharacterized OB-fold protein